MSINHSADRFGMRQEALEFPMMCVIGLSYRCNAACPSCPYTNSDIRQDYLDRPFMLKETFRLIADQCGEYGAWVRVSGGGEPMLHPEAVELMEYAKQRGAKVGLITNGSCFTEEGLRKLLQAGVDMIEFSVDASDPETYARVRAGLKWDVLYGNVTMAVELRNRLSSPTKIIASGVNQEGVDIERTAQFWEKLVDNFQKRKYLTWGINDPARSADTTPYLPPEEHIPCPFIFERLNIDSRGKITVCGFDISSVTDMGNIHEKSISEIWHGEEFEFYRRMHLERRGSEIEMCSRCPDWKYRSWNHNYWKIVNSAEKTRQERFERLDLQDAEGCMADTKENT